MIYKIRYAIIRLLHYMFYLLNSLLYCFYCASYLTLLVQPPCTLIRCRLLNRYINGYLYAFSSKPASLTLLSILFHSSNAQSPLAPLTPGPVDLTTFCIPILLVSLNKPSLPPYYLPLILSRPTPVKLFYKSLCTSHDICILFIFSPNRCYLACLT